MSTTNLIPVGIVGTGISIPDGVLSNRELENMVDTSDEWIKARTGIHERRIVAKDQNTSDLAVEAGLNALKDAGLEAADIDLIIVASVTPDYPFPATACLVQDRIGASKAAAFDLSAGCSGFVYALITGAQFIAAGTYRRVLVIGAESLSKIINWQDRNTCVLFGDGAGAVVLTAVESGYGLLSGVMGSDGSGGQLLNTNEEGYLEMVGKEVFKFAVRIMGESVPETVRQAGLKMEDIDMFIPHQANYRIIEAAARKLKISLDKMFINVHAYGNTSAASIPVALHEARMQGKIKRGDNLLFMGFGAGLTWAGAVLKWSI